MSGFILPATSYRSVARDVHRTSTNTIIEDEPADLWCSENDFTPRQATFNDLYDVSDDEAIDEDVPIVISISPLQPRKHQTPNLLSPTGWPTADRAGKLGQQTSFDANMLSPRLRIPSEKLALVTNRNSIHSSSAPSLAGSLTSDEMASFSCPTTPDISSAEEDPTEWTLPPQLQPGAMTTLGHLTQRPTSTQNTAFQPVEMREKAGPLSLDTKVDVGLAPIDGELSAISMPSPGGLLSQSDGDSRSAWLTPCEDSPLLATAVAANFYGVPFQQSPKESIVSPLPSALPSAASFRPRNIEIFGDTDLTEGPPTARRIPAHWTCGTPGLQALKSPDFTQELHDFNENYERQLRESSTSNIDRTASWLNSCQQAIEEEDVVVEEHAEIRTSIDETLHETVESSDEQATDDLLFRAFKHIQTTKGTSDAFVHRKTRTEKLRLDRKCLFTSRIDQLQNKYRIATPAKDKPQAQKAGPLEDIAEKEAIAAAVQEQDALRQTEPVSWNVEALKYLNGGTLLTSPTAKVFSRKRTAKVLDLGGHATCDWSWQVALEYPDVLVQTVTTPDLPINKDIATPKNHKQKVVPNLWTLPFANDYFDCVSARNIYSLLKLQRPHGRSSDEYDLCLKECMRVLRPGGYLEFTLFDADIMNAGASAADMNMQFDYNLRCHGYDPAPTKGWLNRVRRQGFENIRRAWLMLPMTQHSASREGTTADASHITGMVGSWAYERWMVKLNMEMGKDESRLLEGVAAVLEEGARTGASWRCLSGWARKPF